MRHFNWLIVLASILIWPICGCKKEVIQEPVGQTGISDNLKLNVHGELPVTNAKNEQDSAAYEDDRPILNMPEPGIVVKDGKLVEVETNGHVADGQIVVAAPGKTDDPCDAWGENDLFRDRHVFHYALKLENEMFDVEGDDYECDDSGCTRSVDIVLTCTAIRIGKDIGICASKLECKCQPSRYWDEIPNILEGYWVRDENGYYKLDPSFRLSEITKSSTPGACKNSKGIECKPGTLAYEYGYFHLLLPTIPTPKSGRVGERNYDPEADMTDSWEARLEKDIWCREEAHSGGDESINEICIHPSRGIVRFKDVFSGGFNRELKGELE